MKDFMTTGNKCKFFQESQIKKIKWTTCISIWFSERKSIMNLSILTSIPSWTTLGRIILKKCGDRSAGPSSLSLCHWEAIVLVLQSLVLFAEKLNNWTFVYGCVVIHITRLLKNRVMCWSWTQRSPCYV